MLIRTFGLFICVTTLVAASCQGTGEGEGQPQEVGLSEAVQTDALTSEPTTTEPDLPTPDSATIEQTEALGGPWRDQVGTAWDFNLRIIEEEEQYSMILTPRGEPSFRRELVELAAAAGETRRFQVDGSDESYAIRTDGNLGLYDRDGFIRVARSIP